jgi:thiamine-monophosphate kinase
MEDVHFNLRHFRFEDIGHKALAVNLSDLAAMGARPAWFVCALALPPSLTDRAVARLANGMSALARGHDITLVGGNITSSRELSITITAAGHVKRSRALTRGGAGPEDILFVSGTLGDARLGLEQLERGERGVARHRQLRPQPRVRLGQLATAYARAAIDVSDGFAQDLAHLCQASGVGAQVEVDQLPLSYELRRIQRAQALRWALAGGEDYELILAVPRGKARAFERACRESGEQVTRVGRLTRGAQVQFFLAGKKISVPRGFDHFRSPRQSG